MDGEVKPVYTVYQVFYCKGLLQLHCRERSQGGLPLFKIDGVQAHRYGTVGFVPLDKAGHG